MKDEQMNDWINDWLSEWEMYYGKAWEITVKLVVDDWATEGVGEWLRDSG